MADMNGLTQGDFEFFRSKAKDMLSVHEKEFISEIDPNLMRAMYRGRTKYEVSEKATLGDISNVSEHLTALSIIFQTENTVIPQLLWQMPSPIVKPGRGSDRDSAALMTAILKHYMKFNNAKRQNQEAVMNARFFGLGWKKLGWRAVFEPKTDEPESQPSGEAQNTIQKAMSAVTNMLGMGQARKPDSTESRERPELVDYETLFNDSESPMSVALDDKADMWNSKAILHSLPRTLHDLENSGNYDEKMLEELLEHCRVKYGSRFDSRKNELHLRELHIQQRNGIWILPWVDEFDKPLNYYKSDYQGRGFLLEPLSLTYEPGVRYPTSHLRVGSQVQKKLDDLTTLYVELAARSVNLVVVNERAMANGQMPNLERNLARGLIKTKGPIGPQDIQNFASGNVSSDIPNLIGLLQQKVAEILGADPQQAFGKSENETLGQDELARSGSKSRESGQRDRIRDWMVEQLRKEAVLIKQYSNSELHVQITGKDYADPATGQTVSDKWLSFMTEDNPLGARHYLQGEFEFDLNMDEAVRPDKKSIREALTNMLELTSNPDIEMSCLQQGFRFRKDKIAVGLASTLDNVINPEEYIERLDSRQVAAIQTQKMLMRGSMEPKPVSVGGKKQSNSEHGVSNPSSNQANV